MSLDQKKIGEAIKFYRKQVGFTQKGLADRLFISDKAISKWERGLSVPDIAYLGKLAVLLDTDIDTLLEGKHESHDDRWKGLLVTDHNKAEVSLITSIYDKPMVYYLISYFLLVGIREIMIVCTKSEERQLRELLGDGEALSIRLKYKEKNQTSNIGCVISNNSDFFKGNNVMTVFGNMILYGANLTYFLRRAMLNKGQHTILAVPMVNSGDMNYITFDFAKRITQKNTITTKYDYHPMPILFSSWDLLQQNLWEVSTVDELVEKLVCKESLFVEKLSRGIVAINNITLDDALETSTIIRMIQKHTGTYVACLEEIAWRRGLINLEQLNQLGNSKADTEYGKYILKLCSTQKLDSH